MCKTGSLLKLFVVFKLDESYTLIERHFVKFPDDIKYANIIWIGLT